MGRMSLTKEIKTLGKAGEGVDARCRRPAGRCRTGSQPRTWCGSREGAGSGTDGLSDDATLPAIATAAGTPSSRAAAGNSGRIARRTCSQRS